MNTVPSPCNDICRMHAGTGFCEGCGRTIDEITAEMHMVAEGVKTTRVVLELAERHGLAMPIAREVYGVLYEGGSARDAYRGLVHTRPGDEAEPG